MKKLRLFCFAAILAANCNSFAQTKSAAPTNPPRAAVETYISELKSVIAKRQESVTQIVNQIAAQDSSIKTAMVRIMSILTTSKDSLETKTGVAQLKEEALAGLKRAAEAYVQKRAAATEELRTVKNDYHREDLFTSRGEFDQRINNLINAAVQLALSMDTDEGHEKYIKDPDVMAGGGGIWVPSVRRNPEYEHNKKQVAHTDKVKQEIEKALNASLQRLDIQARSLSDKLKQGGLSDEERRRLSIELDRIASLQEDRRQQEIQLETATQETIPMPLDTKEFVETEDLVDGIAAGARRDFQRMMAAYNALHSEQHALADLKAKLDHAEKWLESHPGTK
jgi:hypothetical protein